MAMTDKEIIAQLEGLRVYCKDMLTCSDLDDIWQMDIQALSEAIKIIKERKA